MGVCFSTVSIREILRKGGIRLERLPAPLAEVKKADDSRSAGL